jgi:hypothetical protein
VWVALSAAARRGGEPGLKGEAGAEGAAEAEGASAEFAVLALTNVSAEPRLTAVAAWNPLAHLSAKKKNKNKNADESNREEEEEEEQEEEINTCERLSALWLHFACGAYLEYFL